MRQPYLVKRLRTYLSMTLRVVPLSEFWCIFKNDLALNQPLREREREKTSHRNDFSVIPFIGWYTGLSLSGSVSDAAVRRLSPTLNNNSFFFLACAARTRPVAWSSASSPPGDPCRGCSHSPKGHQRPWQRTKGCWRASNWQLNALAQKGRV